LQDDGLIGTQCHIAPERITEGHIEHAGNQREFVGIVGAGGHGVVAVVWTLRIALTRNTANRYLVATDRFNETFYPIDRFSQECI
jgi:hypothetical protein